MLVRAACCPVCRSHQEHSDPLQPVAYFVLDDDWFVSCSLHPLSALDYCFAFTTVYVKKLRNYKIEDDDGYLWI